MQAEIILKMDFNENETPDKPDNKDESWKLTHRDFRASSLGWEIAIPIVGGPVLGQFLDRKFGTGIDLTLIFLVLGIMAGTYYLLRYIEYEKAFLSEDEDNEEEDEN